MVGAELCFSPREGFALQLLRLAARDPTGGVGIKSKASRPATDLRKGERRTMSSTVLGLKEKGACQTRPVFIAVCKLTYQSQFRSFGGLPISTRKWLGTASWMRIAENCISLIWYMHILDSLGLVGLSISTMKLTVSWYWFHVAWI